MIACITLQTIDAQGISVFLKNGINYNFSDEVLDSIANHYESNKSQEPKGITIYRKEGGSLTVPYDQLDFIETYDYDDAPEEHTIIDLGLPSVNLGLPSGLLWATMNVGAQSPEDYGTLFAWGETIGYKKGKDNYSWNTYKWTEGNSTKLTKYCDESTFGYNGYTDNLITLETTDDAASVNWGGDWRMPTQSEWEELGNTTYCKWTWYDKSNTEFHGIAGCKIESIVEGYEGNFIFLPAAGYVDTHDSNRYSVGVACLYWSSSLAEHYALQAWSISKNNNNQNLRNNRDRVYGLSVRPVIRARKVP